MNRRKFLSSAGLILGAPAIVRAESLMKIWVPPEPSWIGVDLARTHELVGRYMTLGQLKSMGLISVLEKGEYTVISALCDHGRRPRVTGASFDWRGCKWPAPPTTNKVSK